MELVLEQNEVVELLREALKARGVRIPTEADVRLRRNNKKGTLRVAFVSHSDQDQDGEADLER